MVSDAIKERERKKGRKVVKAMKALATAYGCENPHWDVRTISTPEYAQSYYSARCVCPACCAAQEVAMMGFALMSIAGTTEPLCAGAVH